MNSSFADKWKQLPLEWNIGASFQWAWSHFARNFGDYMVFTFIQLLLIAACLFIPYVNLVAPILVIPLLRVGYYFMADDVQKEEPRLFTRFFAGFVHWQRLLAIWVPAILVLLLLLGAGIALTIYWNLEDRYWEYEQAFDPDRLIRHLDLYNAYPMLLFSLSFTLLMAYLPMMASLGVITLNLGVAAAWQLAWRLFGKNLLAFIGLFIFSGLLNGLSYFTYGLSALVTIPLLALTQYGLFYQAVLQPLREEATAEEPGLEPLQEG